MNMLELMKVFNSYIVILIPITLGVTAIAKKLLPFKEVNKVSPLISLVVGVAASLLVIGLTRQAAIVGIIVGLSASGLWSVAINPFKKKK